MNQMRFRQIGLLFVALTSTHCAAEPLLDRLFQDAFFKESFLPDAFIQMEIQPMPQPVMPIVTRSFDSWQGSMLHKVEREMCLVKQELDRLSHRYNQLQGKHQQLLEEVEKTQYTPLDYAQAEPIIEAREYPDHVALTVRNITLPGHLENLFSRNPESITLRTNEGTVSAQLASNDSYGPMLEYRFAQQQQETKQDASHGYRFYGSITSSVESRGAISVSRPLQFASATAAHANDQVTITIPKAS